MFFYLRAELLLLYKAYRFLPVMDYYQKRALVFARFLSEWLSGHSKLQTKHLPIKCLLPMLKLRQTATPYQCLSSRCRFRLLFACIWNKRNCLVCWRFWLNCSSRWFLWPYRQAQIKQKKVFTTVCAISRVLGFTYLISLFSIIILLMLLFSWRFMGLL